MDKTLRLSHDEGRKPDPARRVASGPTLPLALPASPLCMASRWGAHFLLQKRGEFKEREQTYEQTIWIW